MSGNIADRKVEALLLLLRAGLWEKELEDLSIFPLSADDWTEIFRMARRQTVTGIVYRGLCRLPDSFLPPESVLLPWVATVERIERSNHRMNTVLLGLYRRCYSVGVEPVLQKGQGVALFYEQPWVRECGDIDLYFPSREDSEKVFRLVNGADGPIKRMPDGSLTYTCRGVTVEHHERLMDLYNPFIQPALASLEQVQPSRRIRLSLEDQTEIIVPSALTNLILLDVHILKHALGWGIGLRQLCDMARACYKLRHEVDAAEMQTVCAKLGLKKWNRLLYAFLVRYLGLPMECLPYADMDQSAGALLEIVLRGGNFGYQQSGRAAHAGWSRKWWTLSSFLRNLRFTSRYAPMEGWGTVTRLVVGQFGMSDREIKK